MGKFRIDINAIKLNASTEMGNNSGSCQLFAFHEMSFYCTLYAVNFNTSILISHCSDITALSKAGRQEEGPLYARMCVAYIAPV